MMTKKQTTTMLTKVHHTAGGSHGNSRVITRAPRNTRVKKMVVEMYGGEPYEFYPLGKYIVAAPEVCRGRPTFKYTRVEVNPIVEAMAGGWSVNDVVSFYRRPEISEDAVREAVRLVGAALVNSVILPELANDCP